MRGHLGTELLNKVTDCFEVSKNSGVFKVSCTASRNVPCSALAFSIDEEGDFCIEDMPVKDDEKKVANEKRKRVLRECFSEHQSMAHTELVNAYMQQGDVKKSTAKSHIKEAKEEGFLSLSNKLYCIASD